MSNILELPQPAAAKIEELRQIIEEYPETIPVIVMAKFLGIDKDGLRTCIEQGGFKYGICWQSPNRASGGRYPGKKCFKIMSVPFWLAYTNNTGIGMREVS